MFSSKRSAKLLVTAVGGLAIAATFTPPAQATTVAPPTEAASATPTAQVEAAAVPAGFVRHTLRNWVWYGPKAWVAAGGANDLYVFSPTGTVFMHYGASAAPCVSPAAYFASVRRGHILAAKSNLDLYSYGLTGARFLAVGPIKPIGGPYYYRQTSTFEGKRPGGKVIKGEMVLDFFYAGAGACGERMQVRSAPAQGNAAALANLRKIQSLVFGPYS